MSAFLQDNTASYYYPLDTAEGRHCPPPSHPHRTLQGLVGGPEMLNLRFPGILAFEIIPSAQLCSSVRPYGWHCLFSSDSCSAPSQPHGTEGSTAAVWRPAPPRAPLSPIYLHLKRIGSAGFRILSPNCSSMEPSLSPCWSGQREGGGCMGGAPPTAHAEPGYLHRMQAIPSCV